MEMLEMNDSRLELQDKLEEILGSNHVYFQPPESIRLSYPCIIYERSGIDNPSADNRHYYYRFQYDVMYISKNPDTNDFIMKMLDEFEYCRYERHFVSDNLNHETFSLYF